MSNNNINHEMLNKLAQPRRIKSMDIDDIKLGLELSPHSVDSVICRWHVQEDENEMDLLNLFRSYDSDDYLKDNGIPIKIIRNLAAQLNILIHDLSRLEDSDSIQARIVEDEEFPGSHYIEFFTMVPEPLGMRKNRIKKLRTHYESLHREDLVAKCNKKLEELYHQVQ